MEGGGVEGICNKGVWGMGQSISDKGVGRAGMNFYFFYFASITTVLVIS